jgi:hypothetical protein
LKNIKDNNSLKFSIGKATPTASSTFGTFNKMAVTEFVFPRLTTDLHLLQAFKTALPPAAKVAFSDVPGLLNYQRGRIVKAQNISDGSDLEHSGLAIVLGVHSPRNYAATLILMSCLII